MPGVVPTKLKILNGNPGKRPILPEPEPIPIAPECPDFLKGPAREQWEMISKELERLGLLTTIDGAAFADYCWLHGESIKAMKKLQEEEMLHKTPNGYIIPKAEFTILRDMLKLKKEYASLFGLTPSGRVKLGGITPKQESSEIENMINW